MFRLPASRPRLISIAAAVALAGAGLAGCSSHAGAAASLQIPNSDGTTSTVTISESEVQAATEELSALNLTSSDVLKGLVQYEVLAPLAKKYGITVDDAAAVKVGDSYFAGNGLQAPDSFSEGAMDLFRTSVISAQLQELDQEQAQAMVNEFNQIADQVSLEESPRYITPSWLAAADSTSTAR